MNIGIFLQVQASVLYLLPIAVVLLWLANRQTFVAELAVWIPAAVALDMLICLLACWALPLDVVLLVSRAGWLLAGIELLRRRHWRVGWVKKPTGSQAATILAAGVVGYLLSLWISRPSSVWDRPFHLPLVSMLRHQRLPFLAVFQSDAVLHYHFAGDVTAAALQVFSLGRMHSSLALALHHDLMFALVAMSLAAWLVSHSQRRLWVLAGMLAVFLSGPLALQRTGMGSNLGGYSFLSMLCMSYRPGIVAAMLFLVGAFAAVVLQLHGLTEARRRSVVAIFLCMAPLAISDEPSAGVFGIGLAAAWVVAPNIFHPDRRLGFLVLIGLAVTIIASNVIFQAALVPGGPVQGLKLVPFRSPGYSEPSLPLFSRRGMYAFLLDMGPLLAIAVAAIGASWNKRFQPTWSLTVVLGATMIVGVLGLTVIDLHGAHIENHRFITVCLVIFPMAALLLLTQLSPGRWERVLLMGALIVPAVSSIFWGQYGIGDPDLWFTDTVDCRIAANAGLFEKPRPTYIPPRSFYAYSGCRPVFFPGAASGDNNWSGLLANGYPYGGKGAFEILHNKFVRPTEPLATACPTVDDGDKACAFAKSQGRCRPSGAAFQTCELTPADRQHLLQIPW